VRLSWQPPAQGSAAGYRLYRSSTPFTDPGSAVQMGGDKISATVYTDLPPAEGTYIYRVVTVNAAGNVSELSDPATGISDATAPRVVSIVYTPRGAYAPSAGIFGAGTVDIELTVSEPLESTPFLSINPNGGGQATVALTAQSDTVYTGFFVISETAPSGEAWAIFSARDRAGMRGTEVEIGKKIQIDTDGPEIDRMAVLPASPIANDAAAPVQVTVSFGLNDKVAEGTVPTLSYRLSGTGRELIEISEIIAVAPAADDVQTWQAVFTLPADAGQAEPETFYFVFSAEDALGNIGADISVENLFQVYQGDLPPLEPPEDFTADGEPGGKIRLSWKPVEDASGYVIYRMAPGETDLTEHIRLEAVTSYLDEPAQEGAYLYAAASIREENADEAVSGLSETAAAESDATAPGAPQKFKLELVANGIKAEWNPPPAATEAVTYRIYREAVDEILSVSGLSPLAAGIEQTLVVDPNPSTTAHCYAVTAVDAVGNESAPSNSDYLNVQLLPVDSLSVVQEDQEAPTISWTHPSSNNPAIKYDLYLGTKETGIKLNAQLLSSRSYTDTGYSGDDRTYTVVAVDDSGYESLARSITLPAIDLEPEENSLLYRGIMNRLFYQVTSGSDSTVSNLRLKTQVIGKTHRSEYFNLGGNGTESVPVVVGGYDNLPDAAVLTTTAELSPRPNEFIRIVRNGWIDVSDRLMVADIANEEFTRGVSGKVHFTLENTGDAEVEIVTARNNGSKSSNEITFYLIDEDGNVIATAPFKQATGDSIVTLPDGRTVARIPAGETFTSAPIAIPIPQNAPDTVTVRLSISKIHYHLGKDTAVTMTGMATTHPVALIDTSYYGEVTDIAPVVSMGGENIVISGRAVERSTEAPMADVPIRLVITLKGFERTYEIFTDQDGNFSHEFKPLSGEAGVYKVRAVHPDLTDKPVHGTFTINKLVVSPSKVNLNISKNYEQSVSVRATTAEGTTANNLRLVFDEQTVPTGVHLTAGNTISRLTEGKSANLSFRIWADNTAPKNATVIFKLVSDETEPDAWGQVKVQASFSEALPALYFTPNHIDTGAARNQSVTESVTLKNRGLAAMTNVRLSLTTTSGQPAPNWVVLNSAGNVGDIEVGQNRSVSMAFSPTEEVAEGNYEYYLRVAADNHKTTNIRLYVAVTQSGKGSALFKVSDIYTGTPDGKGGVIEGLSGAKVRLQNEEVDTEIYNRTTDAVGEARFADIPAGRYKSRVTANNHQEFIGRVWIKPGVTAIEDIFLDYNLVTVEWSVSEITVEDKYDIVLTATYATKVPAAVVAIKPASVTLPSMRTGDVYNGEFTLTNYGLIRADDLKFNLPGSNAHFRFELLGGLPDSLGAGQTITVPYRVTCLLSPDGGDGGTGGGRGGQISSPAPAPSTVKGVICFPGAKYLERFFKRASNFVKDTWKHVKHIVGCSVNTFTREFNEDVLDLTVKVPGGRIEVKRWFYANNWTWEHERNSLKIKASDLDGSIRTIDKGGVEYEATSTGSNVFVSDVFKIVLNETGYRWEAPRGNWIDYDKSGRPIAYGNIRSTVGRFLYRGVDDEKPTGLADRNRTQVIWFEYDAKGRLSKVSDAANRTVEYGYTNGRLSNVQDVLENNTTYTYDSKGCITRKVDAGGRHTVVTYDGYGNVASVTDKDGIGHFFEFDFDQAKQEHYARITTASKRVKEIWYDRYGDTRRVKINGRTVLKIDKDGRNHVITGEKDKITRKEYDEWDNLTRVVYPDGSEASFEYDLRFNQLSRLIDQRGTVSEYEYNEHGNLVRKVEALGTDAERVSTYTYNDTNQLLTATVEGDDRTQEATTKYDYDVDGNLVSITDPENHTIEFLEYDSLGNLLRMEDARGYEWKFKYDDMGRLEPRTDPLQRTIKYEYDDSHNRTAIINADLKRVEYEYDEHSNLVKSIDPYLNFNTIEYNTDDLPTKVTDAEGKVSRIEYDNEGRLRVATDGAGNQIVYNYDETEASIASSHSPVQIDYPTFSRKFEYDSLERIIKEFDLLDETTTYTRSFEYDAAGNLIGSADEQENPTSFQYDALNRLVKTIDARQGTVRRFYDARGNLISVEDPNRGVTFYEYDRNDRLTKMTQPLLQETRYEYDEAGNRTVVYDSKGQKIEYEYDPLNRMSRVRYYAAGDHTNPVKEVHFTYNEAGKLETYDDGTTSASYTYDDLQRKLSETVNYGPFSLTYDYEYYANGLKKTFTGPDGETITYNYDENNRPASFVIPGQGNITYNTYEWNGPTRISLPGGSQTEYQYDPLMRVKDIVARDPGQNDRMTRHYTYYPTGTLWNKNTEHGNYRYQYDELQRLTEATNPQSENESYTYDAIGNRLTSADVAGDWNYNANNELLDYGDVTFQYDNNGNTIQKSVDQQVHNYIYDVEDRLLRVEDGLGSTVSDYYYDPFGRRLWKEVDGVRTYFFYSDEGLVGEFDESANQLRAYGWEPNSEWSTNPLFVKQDGKYYWYLNDHIGTPQQIVDTSGRVVWSAVYDSFGNCQIQVSEIVNNLRFAGQYYDVETGLYYNLNRYYNPSTGRYMRIDPFGEGLNLYLYVINNPNTLIDPLGLTYNPFSLGMRIFGDISEQLELWAPTNPGLIVVATLLKTVADVGYGISSTPFALWQQVEDFIDDPLNPNKIPILGPLGEFLGTTTAMAVEDPSLYTISQAVGAYSEAFLLVAGSSVMGKTGKTGTSVKGRTATTTSTKNIMGCFIVGTLVNTQNGLRPIEELEPGDMVLARDEITGEIALQKVLRTFERPDVQIVELTLEDDDGSMEQIGTTAEHPFWVKARGWVFAGELVPGDEVFTSSGGWLRVTSGTWLSTRQTVYNFEVEEFNSYFVGELGAWVHNTNGPCTATNVPKRRTPAELKKAQNKYKNNKQKARDAYEERTGQEWPVDEHGNFWPGEHTPPLKEGGDPMVVTPRDPGAPDPHNIPGPDGLTDYQKWGAEGTPARLANKKGK